MSLKAFHVVFITASILMALGVGAFSLVKYSDERQLADLLLGIGSVLSAFGLVVYGRYVLKKLKNISYL